ncbi:signal transduction histidine kinase [Kribbella sp. VKM Ac-2527]|uniref:histidine kinase n=2 Tax=Kribbella caucasensis TaxID=2512215 RepID=A0A4R6K501_9ACTN|nr:signal transduction histidine kinase [Kribbella sp. VKM Ac-2527]
MMLIAAAATAVVLMVGGAALAVTLRTVMIDEAMDASRLRARDLGALAAGNALPDFAPIGHEGDLVQVVGTDGRILVSSANIAGKPALELPRQPPGSTREISVDSLPVGDPGPYRIVAHGIGTPSGPATVYVAVSVEEIDETVTLVGQVFLAAIPIFVLLLSVAMWTVLGRTLAPVETIRREAAAITGRRLDRRVSEPPQYDEIGRLARTVNAMLARLQDSAERQRRFVADTAHELRSPIASLRTQLETARASHRPVDWDEISADLLDETVRMQQLEEQLLLLARADAGTLGRTRTTVDLDDVVDTVVAGARGRIDAGGSERSPTGSPVRVDRHDVEPVQVTGDALLLEQLVRNLVDNAVAHATREVRIGLSIDGDEAVLTVDDDGPGVPVERRQEIFERFTRLDGARDRDHGGAGLGLAIVADIVKAHDGVVEVGDAPLGGARFRVRLPVAGEDYARRSLRKS